MSWKALSVLWVPVFFLTGGCAKQASQGACYQGGIASVGAGASGSSKLFLPDPMIASNNLNLSPTAINLDDYVESATLSRLGGHGLLEGQYVDIRDGSCGGGFGAYDAGNNFVYPHSDFRFSEAMAYFHGDQYREKLDAAHVLQPNYPVKIVAHCTFDNAYFSRQVDPATGQVISEGVCLGDSSYTQNTSYGDDGIVTVHELQHATTVNTYHPVIGLNRLWYDEAGALNEAISDFMALIHFAPATPGGFDPRLFSRWALGTFIPNHSSTRGAHKCPAYDPTYPNCTGFPGFSADTNTVSYVYPDGMGWPYANNFNSPNFVLDAFRRYKSQEEIHNAGVLMEGALWDAYQAVRANNGGSDDKAFAVMSEAVMTAVGNLPKPTLNAQSPVTYVGFASELIKAAPAAEQGGISAALTARGLAGFTPLPANWAGDPNTPVTNGVGILDNPVTLKGWLASMGVNPALVPQGIGTGLDGKMDPGELVAVWFDVPNVARQTAGGVQVTVTSLDPDVSFSPDANIAYIDASHAQILYGKINGSDIVAELTSTVAGKSVPTAPDYFKTDPFYNNGFATALWVAIKPTAAHGKTVSFQVQATPSNGPASTRTFQVTIN